MQPQQIAYGEVIRRAWQLTWRHRALWVLGLLAGGVTAPSFGGRMSPGDWSGGAVPVPGSDVAFDQVLRFLRENGGLIAAIGIAIALIALVVIVLSIIAQGGMARATSDLAQGRAVSLGEAWRAGLHLFWRYLGLWLMLALVAFAVAIMVAALVGIVAALGAQNAGAAVLASLVLGLPAVILGVALAVVLGILVPYAQRAIAVEDLGPVGALRSGW